MDDFEKKLKEDAAAISISASPELRKRIAASLAVEREFRDDRRETSLLHGRLWWLSSLTGLAAALGVRSSRHRIAVAVRELADVHLRCDDRQNRRDEPRLFHQSVGDHRACCAGAG